MLSVDITIINKGKISKGRFSYDLVSSEIRISFPLGTGKIPLE
jgi:hypothetical protein